METRIPQPFPETIVTSKWKPSFVGVRLDSSLSLIGKGTCAQTRLGRAAEIEPVLA